MEFDSGNVSVFLHLWPLPLPGARITSASLASLTCMIRASAVFQSALLSRAPTQQPLAHLSAMSFSVHNFAQSPGLKHCRAFVNGINIHYVLAGPQAAPPVVLIHGWPETWFAWRKQIPVLSQKYRLIVPDLRGYGTSDKPATGYDKRNMAKDIKELIELLGYKKVVMIGHDRGARVTTRFAKDHPHMLDRICTMDNIPTRIVFESMNGRGGDVGLKVSPGALAKGYWFFLFNQVMDLPEALITGREEIWLRHWLSGWSFNRELFSDEEVAEYVKAYSQPGALKGCFNDYRAAPEDTAQDLEDAHVLIKCPILTMWGAEFEPVGKMFDVEAVWKTMGNLVRAVPLPECGHLPQEEQPELVNAELLDYLKDWQG